MFEANIVEKIKSQLLRPITFSFENRTFYELMCKKYFRGGGGLGQATDKNMAHAHCMLDI